MNLQTETYLFLANLLPVAYLASKSIMQLYQSNISKEILLNWIVLVIFLLVWNLFQQLIDWKLYLLIGALFKAGICLVFEQIMNYWKRVTQKYQLQKLQTVVIKTLINLISDWNFYATKLLYKSSNDQEKRLMKDRYNSIFEEITPPIRKQFVNMKIQTDLMKIHTPLPVSGQSKQARKSNQVKVNFKQDKPTSAIKSQKLIKNSDPKSFKQILVNKKQVQKQKTQNIQQISQSVKQLSLKLDVKQSLIQLQDLISPQNNLNNEDQPIRRMNTFSHGEKLAKHSQRWSQQLNISISEQYSYLLGSDDQGKQFQVQQKPIKIVQKRMLKRKQFKKQVTLNIQQTNKQQIKNNNSSKSLNETEQNVLGKVEIYLQTGNNYYKLQKKILKLYENNLIELLNIQNIVVERFKISHLKALRNDFYQLKGQSIQGNPVTKTLRFRGDYSVFKKYIISHT